MLLSHQFRVSNFVQPRNVYLPLLDLRKLPLCIYIKNCCLTFRKTEKIHEMTTIFTQKRQLFSLRTILIVNLLLSFRKGQYFIEKNKPKEGKLNSTEKSFRGRIYLDKWNGFCLKKLQIVITLMMLKSVKNSSKGQLKSE